LNLIGLFDRPADGPAVDTLLVQHIPGLTDELFFERIEKRSDGQFGAGKIELKPLHEAKRTARIREAKRRLRKLRLLSKANPKDPHELDAHPVVRAFFAGRLEETAPEAAKAAHGILYRHYAAAAPDLPDTLDAMQPLFRSVQHGVKAGRTQEVFDEIYLRRISRRNDQYITHILGSFGADLAALAHFFEAPWRTPRRDLRPGEQAWLLGSAAYALTALGRLTNSVEPRRAALDKFVLSEQWDEAARNGGQLTDTLLTLGRVPEAVMIAERAVSHADLGRAEDEREFLRCYLGAALTAAGIFDRAAALFAEAEVIRAKISKRPQLYALGYLYGDLILARGDLEEALTRGLYQLEVATRNPGLGMGLQNIGSAHLLIGRAQDALGKEGAAASLDAAVVGLRKAGRANRIPEALLARAAHRCRRAAAGETDLIDGIRADLAEVEDIAGEEMRLHLTDLALERARLALDVPAAFANAEAARAEARAQTAKAAGLIGETGYHRRDGELAELQARLAAS
jgi:tetratricopeptide (TPR) repeat protein